MKPLTRLGKGVIGAVVSIALLIGCLPITAIPVLAAEGDTPATITLSGTTNKDFVPTRTQTRYAVSEQIYTAAELGYAGGAISSIAFNKTSGNNTTRKWRVYLADTDKTSFTSNTDWIKTATLCYEGSVALNANGWITIDFNKTTSFEHAADKNLAVIVIDYTNNATNSARNFSVYASSSNQCIYANGNSQYTLNTLSANGHRTANKPAIRISILKNMTVTAPDVTFRRFANSN